MKIAIDGPSGAGKSSIARIVAERLGIIYLDTGALYRTTGLYMRKCDIPPEDTESMVFLLSDIDISLDFENGRQVIYLNGVNCGDKIREPEISKYASVVSAIPEVREFLLDIQKETAEKYDVVMDGRDIGTVIMPDADVKIFLTAPLEVRARRRLDQLAEKGIHAEYDDVLREMVERDQRDEGRDIAPSVAAPDAVVLDTSGHTLEESVEDVLRIIREKVDSKNPKKSDG